MCFHNKLTYLLTRSRLVGVLPTSQLLLLLAVFLAQLLLESFLNLLFLLLSSRVDVLLVLQVVLNQHRRRLLYVVRRVLRPTTSHRSPVNANTQNWPTQLRRAWPQNLEPTIYRHGRPTARTVAIFIQARQLKTHKALPALVCSVCVCVCVCVCRFQLCVSYIPSSGAVRDCCEFGADYTDFPTQLNSNA